MRPCQGRARGPIPLTRSGLYPFGTAVLSLRRRESTASQQQNPMQKHRVQAFVTSESFQEDINLRNGLVGVF